MESGIDQTQPPLLIYERIRNPKLARLRPADCDVSVYHYCVRNFMICSFHFFPSQSGRESQSVIPCPMAMMTNVIEFLSFPAWV
jgi:hypothetical protein